MAKLYFFAIGLTPSNTPYREKAAIINPVTTGDLFAAVPVAIMEAARAQEA